MTEKKDEILGKFSDGIETKHLAVLALASLTSNLEIAHIGLENVHHLVHEFMDVETGKVFDELLTKLDEISTNIRRKTERDLLALVDVGEAPAVRNRVYNYEKEDYEPTPELKAKQEQSREKLEAVLQAMGKSIIGILSGEAKPKRPEPAKA